MGTHSSNKGKFSKQELIGWAVLAVAVIVIFGFLLHPSK